MPAPKEKYQPELLRHLFSYCPDSGEITWRNPPPRSKVKVGDVAGCIKEPHGYVRIMYQGGLLLGHRVAWAMYYGCWPDGFLDHVNRNRADNRVVNLRIATHGENMRNRPAAKRNPLGMKGVRKEGARYRACITVNGRRIRLGSFASPEAAYAAYKEAAERHHGEFAAF